MSKGEILDLLYESDHKNFYSDLLCLQKSGSYYKTEKIFSDTPQMLFFDEFGKQIGEALEFNDKAHFYNADHKLLFTVELYVGYFDRVELIFRNAEGNQIRSKKLPYTYKTRKMLEEEKAEREKKERKEKEEEEKRRREEKNRGTPPADGGEGIGGGGGGGRGGVRTVNPWPFIFLCVLLCLPISIAYDRIVSAYPNWLLAAYQVRVFLLKFSEFWVYPVLAALFVLTVRFPKSEGIGTSILWFVLLAGVLTAQYFLSRQLGRMLHTLGLGVEGSNNVKIILLCFLPSYVLFFSCITLTDLLFKIKKLRDSILTIVRQTIKLNIVFSGILLFVCRMSAAWAFQVTAHTTTQMAFRTVWYAVLVFLGFWLIHQFNNFDYNIQQ